ncbi:hypothetical protein EXIGLDRAFT_763043 [Exidia glandulosa HHB12029]|uniref:F5/8 type C domain-containing protein n=1 Tax=Exidia glandulosa HHB12029 TaxID=1314781 RepID=A0A165MC19_EXIGL|nr:hypothetical protein EXIGLDRAFT_763043 [Exidia glandulosa HHB12029]
MRSLIDGDTRISVSGSQDKSTGKRNLTDGKDTCWCSGTPKEAHPWLSVVFPDLLVPAQLVLVFQGGFASRKTAVYYATDSGTDWSLATNIFPDDANKVQSFDLPIQPVRALKLVFEDSTDPFGRITLYDLQLHGTDPIADNTGV